MDKAGAVRTPADIDRSREAIVAFLESNDLGYQRVALPHGLATPGEDRSETARLVLPESLAGKSVLDVGSFLGFFCHEAKRRGAERVVGVEVDEERVRQARAIAAFAGLDIEFRHFDVEAGDSTEAFDVVLLLNVIHHMRDPLAVLGKVSRWARERVVLEVPGFLDPGMKGYLKRSFGWRRRHLRTLEPLPLVGVGRGGAIDWDREQSFVFTPAALENILLEQGKLFARLDVTASPKRGRFLATAHRRRIGELVVVAGVTGVGKSRLCTRLTEHVDRETSARLGVDPAVAWRRVDAQELRSLGTPAVDRLIFHYDILRPRRGGARTYARDEALDVLRCAERVSVLTLTAPLATLVGRVEERIHRLGSGPFVEDARGALALYRRPGEVRRLYEQWIAFLDASGLGTRFVDCSGDDYESVDPEAALKFT